MPQSDGFAHGSHCIQVLSSWWYGLLQPHLETVSATVRRLAAISLVGWALFSRMLFLLYGWLFSSIVCLSAATLFCCVHLDSRPLLQIHRRSDCLHTSCSVCSDFLIGCYPYALLGSGIIIKISVTQYLIPPPRVGTRSLSPLCYAGFAFWAKRQLCCGLFSTCSPDGCCLV